ncbi:MAG: NAD-binding protein, partial [Halovenus sp.]
TLLVLSFVFIALAAQLELASLIDVGVSGIIVVLAVALLIRPVLVFVSAVGDRFTTNEKLFVSFVGPRGIIPASVATLFAVELNAAAEEIGGAQAELLGTQADILLGTVFLVIFATALFEGGLARYIAEKLDVIPMRVIIVGGGQVGRALAARLEDRGENVVIIEQDEESVERARNEGYAVEIGDGTDTDMLRSAGAENAKTVVAATGDDDANLLVSQLARSKFGVERVIARANNPDNVDAFEDLGVRTISSSMATAWAIDNQIERPAIAHWMTDISRDGDVQEVEVTNSELIGKSIHEVSTMLPDACLVALVSGERHENAEVPTADYVLEAGDMLTLLGRRESVRDGMKMVSGD